jgi:uncharacterized glyoxalase superfamily protein PhnB
MPGGRKPVIANRSVPTDIVLPHVYYHDVDDPIATQSRAVAAGAKEHSPVEEHTHETAGPQLIKRMLQGAILDPFGHVWLIGKILE